MTAQAHRPTASFEQWLQAFQAAYEHPGAIDRLACPQCGEHQLNLRFILYGSREDEGHIVFWCCNCNNGIALGPGTVPVGGVTVRRENAQIPQFHVVPPGDGEGNSWVRP